MKIILPIVAKAHLYKTQCVFLVKVTLLFSLFFFSIFTGLPELQANAEVPSIPQVASIAIDTARPEKRFAETHSSVSLYAVSSATIGSQKVVVTRRAASEVKGAETQVGSVGIDSVKAAILSALNRYRERNGKQALVWDGKLASYAQSRADQFTSQNAMDQHAGFREFTDNQNGFEKVGFYALGENSGLGHTIDAVYLIEEAYGKSPGHNANQLDSDYTHVGIGVSGSATDFIFGGKKR